MRTFVALILIAFAHPYLELASRAAEPTPEAAASSVSSGRAAETDDPLIVHEWGTFTTFSGSDGVFLDFRPLADEESDLPSFVVDRASSAITTLFSKKRLRGKVRMETPVTYFYTDRIRQVNVRVGFPDGLLTEFYPPVRKMLPPLDEKAAFGAGEPIGKSSLDWGQVTLIPTSQLAPNIADPVLREQVANHLAAAAVPHSSGDLHYRQARATDSALVHVRAAKGRAFGNFSAPQHDYMEKFLFYRGVGRFELPVQASFDTAGRMTFSNHGQLPLTAAIQIKVDGEEIQAKSIGAIPAGGQSKVESLDQMSLDQLAQVVQEMLVAEGLYAKEAASMVETWKQSWFGEAGTRILYIVPAPITDELLPLTIEPSPDETLRVLVGRMEILPPGQEQQLIQAVLASSKARSAYLQQSKSQQQKPFAISEELHGLGRMLEPALVRVSKIANDGNVRQEAQRLIAQLRK